MSFRCCVVLRSVTLRRAESMGFTMKSNAPSLIASTASSTEPEPVSMITLASRFCFFT